MRATLPRTISTITLAVNQGHARQQVHATIDAGQGVAQIMAQHRDKLFAQGGRRAFIEQARL